MRSLRLLLLATITIAGSGCESHQSATSPSPLPPDPTFAINGTVVRIVTSEPIAGARISSTFGSVVTGGDGAFSLRPTALPTSPLRLTVEAAGFVTRELNVRLDGGGRRDLAIDLIGSAPFALSFYEEFARDRLDNRGQLRVLAPVATPRYVLVTRHTSGGPVAASLLARVRAAVSEMAQAFSDGRATPAIVEAESAPASSTGQIVITFTQDASAGLCGEATVGVESGFVRFYLGVSACACANSEDGLAPAIIRHELGHTLGAYHVSDDAALMNTQPRCSAVATAIERFHASVLFRRPRGNSSPDNDPPGALANIADVSATRCRLPRLR